MPDKEKVYKLPPALAAALLTNRPELVKLYISELKTGRETLTVEGQVELLTLIIDLLTDREEAREKATELEQRLHTVILNIEGNISALQRLLTEVR